MIQQHTSAMRKDGGESLSFEGVERENLEQADLGVEVGSGLRHSTKVNKH